MTSAGDEGQRKPGLSGLTLRRRFGPLGRRLPKGPFCLDDPSKYPPAAGFGLTRDSAAGSLPTDLAFALVSVSGSGVTALPRWGALATPVSNFLSGKGRAVLPPSLLSMVHRGGDDFHIVAIGMP